MAPKRKNGKQLVLEIGPNVKPQIANLYPDAKVMTLDVDPSQKPDIVMDAGDMEYKEMFDAILASHVLEHFPYYRTIDVLTRWKDALIKDGKLIIIVPSWEWSARQVLSETPSKAIWGHTFAGQTNEWDVHRAMFKLSHLRVILEKIGMNVIEARTSKYTLMVGNERVEAEQHEIIGVKR